MLPPTQRHSTLRFGIYFVFLFFYGRPTRTDISGGSSPLQRTAETDRKKLKHIFDISVVHEVLSFSI